MSSKQSQQGQVRQRQAHSGRPANAATEVVKETIENKVLCGLKIVALVVPMSLATLASQLALHPLYGSTVSSLHFKHVLAVACVVSTLCPTVPAHQLFRILSVFLATAPLSAKHLGAWLGRWDSALWGPILTQIPLAASFVGLSCILIRGWMTQISPYAATMTLKRLPLAVVFVGAHFIEPILWEKIPFGGPFTSCNIFLSLSIAASICAALTVPVIKSKNGNIATSFAMPAVILSISLGVVAYSKTQSPCTSPPLPAIFTSVHYPPINNSLINQMSARLGWISPANIATELPRNVTVNLLAKSDSVTGTIVVGEYLEEGFRFLRADHSILGGRWINPKYPGVLGESIYGAFTLQEAIRLVERNTKEGDSALVIGLGVGIAAEALIKHGNKVHIVEIDPSVYAYARGFFDLSEPHAVHLIDARKWVHDHHSLLNATALKTEAELESSKFSMVIHDCFSGGGVPSHIFTLEFWDEVKGIMTADGALAVNFAGHLGSEAARAIWFTLQEAFARENGGRGCRVFHDLIRQAGEKDGSPKMKEDEFLNMVYFCQKDDGKLDGAKRVTFRKAREADYLRSMLRRMVLSTMLEREVAEAQITGLSGGMERNGTEWLLTDKNNRLGGWQHDTAIEHWSVMRQVMPYNVWEVY